MKDIGLDLLGAHPQQGADLRLAEPVELGQHQSGPLALGQRLQCLQGLPEVLSLLHRRGGVSMRVERFLDHIPGPPTAQDGQAGVASDGEQPGAHSNRPLVGQ